MTEVSRKNSEDNENCVNMLTIWEVLSCSNLVSQFSAKYILKRFCGNDTLLRGSDIFQPKIFRFSKCVSQFVRSCGTHFQSLWVVH